MGILLAEISPPVRGAAIHAVGSRVVLAIGSSWWHFRASGRRQGSATVEVPLSENWRPAGRARLASGLGFAIWAAACGGDGAAAPELPVSVVIAPAQGSLLVGGSLRLTADARDRNGIPMTGQQFTWTSGNSTIASVDGSGLVTGVGAGRATISARVGAITGTAQIDVAARSFAPSKDTTVSGSVHASHFTIPAGVTVRVTNGLAVIADSAVRIAGILSGDCVAIDVRSAGDLEVTGTVDNTCADSSAAGQPLRLIANGAITLVNAGIRSFGDIEVANDLPAAALFPFSAAASSLSVGSLHPPANNGEPNTCNGRNVVIHGGSLYRADAQAGSPAGANGLRGSRVWITCDGDLTLDGVNLRSGPGQRGGSAAATPTAAAVGGNGGDGGEVKVAAAGRITFTTSHLEALPGGSGGGATSTGSLGQKAEAYGGAGGLAGLVRISAGGGVNVAPDGLVIELWGGGFGGSAFAQGRNGSDAGNQAASPGESAKAEGGKAGNIGFSPGLRLIGDLIQGTVTGAANVTVTLHQRQGGEATVAGGSGGHGNAQFPDAANAGVMTGLGGNGSDVWIQDNRNNTWLGPPGDGGPVTFRGALGGAGFGTCQGSPIPRGGSGGKGGRADGRAGLGGTNPGGATGIPGRTFVGGLPPHDGQSRSEATGNGGRGGDGAPAGAGGGAGERAFVTVGEVVETHNQLFQPGAGGAPCAPPPPPVCEPTVNTESAHLLEIGDAIGAQTALCSVGTSLVNTSPVFHPSYPAVPAKPRAGNHTTTKFLGGTGPIQLSSAAAQALTAWMNQPNRIRLGPTTPLAGGQYFIVYNVLSAAVPTADATNQYQYRFLFDCDAISSNNYFPSATYDFTRNTDFWVDLRYSGSWSLVSTFAQNNNPFTFASGARAVIVGSLIVAILPQNLFPSATPGLRFTTFRHTGDGGVGGDWDGDVQPPVLSPLYQLPVPVGTASGTNERRR